MSGCLKALRGLALAASTSLGGCCPAVAQRHAMPTTSVAAAAVPETVASPSGEADVANGVVDRVATGVRYGLLLCAIASEGGGPGELRLRLVFVKLPRQYNWMLRAGEAVYLTWYGACGELAPAGGTAKVKVVISDAFQGGGADVYDWVADVRPPPGATAFRAEFGALRTGVARVPVPSPAPAP
jgi:hypothetical protein